MMKRILTSVLFAVCLMVCGCSDDEGFVAPAFIHMDAMKVVANANNPVSTDPGFYTSDITSVYVTAYYSGARAHDTLGLFELPFTVPVLHSGEVEYFEISPAVKQSGIAGVQPYYSYYNRVKLENITLTSGDTVGFDTLSTTYNITRSDVLMAELFEPTEGSLLFDTAMKWNRYAATEACSGQGYGSVHVPASMSSVPFAIDLDFYVSDPTKLLYLELDSRSDVRFEVYMKASRQAGSAAETQRVMVVNPSERWNHMYINLGRTWAWLGYPATFRITFAALNVEGAEGEVRLDNVKLLTTNYVL